MYESHDVGWGSGTDVLAVAKNVTNVVCIAVSGDYLPIRQGRQGFVQAPLEGKFPQTCQFPQFHKSVWWPKTLQPIIACKIQILYLHNTSEEIQTLLRFVPETPAYSPNAWCFRVLPNVGCLAESLHGGCLQRQCQEVVVVRQRTATGHTSNTNQRPRFKSLITFKVG